jgi:hypothetical protein
MVARLLLVHSPLVGPGTWDLVAADLAGRDPDMGGIGVRPEQQA